MHQVVLERWSRLDSPIHRRDPRAKLAAFLCVLVAVALAPPAAWLQLAGFWALGLASTWVARLNPVRLGARLLVVLPFPGVLALIAWISGEPLRAWSILWKSCISAYFVLLLVATTPMPRLLAGLNSFKVPEPLLLTLQFLYRYLFVISEQAQHMLLAARSRGGNPSLAHGGHRRLWFHAAAGVVAVLFVRSFERATRVHQAMLARGFTGGPMLLEPGGLRGSDVAFAAAVAAYAVVLSWLPWAR